MLMHYDKNQNEKAVFVLSVNVCPLDVFSFLFRHYDARQHYHIQLR